MQPITNASLKQIAVSERVNIGLFLTKTGIFLPVIAAIAGAILNQTFGDKTISTLERWEFGRQIGFSLGYISGISLSITGTVMIIVRNWF